MKAAECADTAARFKGADGPTGGGAIPAFDPLVDSPGMEASYAFLPFETWLAQTQSGSSGVRSLPSFRQLQASGSTSHNRSRRASGSGRSSAQHKEVLAVGTEDVSRHVDAELLAIAAPAASLEGGDRRASGCCSTEAAESGGHGSRDEDTAVADCESPAAATALQDVQMRMSVGACEPQRREAGRDGATAHEPEDASPPSWALADALLGTHERAEDDAMLTTARNQPEETRISANLVPGARVVQTLMDAVLSLQQREAEAARTAAALASVCVAVCKPNGTVPLLH